MLYKQVLDNFIVFMLRMIILDSMIGLVMVKNGKLEKWIENKNIK
jgi:hypothetical protein